MAQGRGYVKVNRVRRFMRRFPDEVRAPIRRVITNTTERILEDAWANVPKQSGNLAQSLSMKVSRDGLTAEVGQIKKRAQRKAFYGSFVEFGTNGYTKGTTRKVRSSKTTKVIRKTVKAQRARPFLYPAAEKAVGLYQRDMRDAIKQTMELITRSGSSE